MPNTAKLTTHFLLGGARSGKSSRAQTIAEQSQLDKVFIATAEAGDDEMAERIARHVVDRGESWTTVEAPLQLCAAIRANCDPSRVVVVDCLTLWLSNIMHEEFDLESSIGELAELVASTKAPLILVSNEVGMGIVPESELSRRFRDAQGRLNSSIAAACAHVELVVAGIPLLVKR